MSRSLLFPLLLIGLASTLVASETLRIDEGAAGAWQKLLKLQTTASLLHTTAHPDDEQGGLLAWASRGRGVRTGLLTLNRGEAGDNAIGSELFDALGLIRTDELLRAGRYYGLDEQYFTLVADYGYSKRLDEALEQWDRDALIGDMVRAIRAFRPLVVISRWQGNERDGHGQHQAAGALTPAAVAAAADPARYPELEREGLRPWRVRKLYRGGAREQEAWHLRIDPGAYDPVLGDSYQTLARYGLSLQRSQTSGRFIASSGPSPLYYTRVGDDAAGREEDPFAGLNVTIEGMFELAGVQAPKGGPALLSAIAREVEAARNTFRFTEPSAAAPALARGLAATRTALRQIEDPEVRFLLQVKERQFEEALASALGLVLTATAEPAGTKDPSGPFAAFAPAVTLDPVTPGQPFDVRLSFTTRGGAAIVQDATILGPEGLARTVPALAGAAEPNAPRVARVSIAVPATARPTRPYFVRSSIAASRYELVDPAGVSRPFAPPAFSARARVAVDGEPITLTTPVVRREANLPFGYEVRELEILPPVAISAGPRVVIAPAGAGPHKRTLEVDVVTYARDGASGSVSVKAPAGWTVGPSQAPFRLGAAGERATLRFEVSIPAGFSGRQQLTASAEVDGRRYSTGYQIIRHRDLPVRYLVTDAAVTAAGFDVSIAPGLRVGYVMGVGDELPAAIRALGAEVTLLDRDDLANGDLSRFHTIITGTRAYAVRDDLPTHNRRLLDWVEAGGNMVVLYNTPEFVPNEFAPYPGELPRDAEEIAEQDAAVEILQPDHPLFTTPNRIGPKDFEGWIEQRGSKFFSTWDERYTPLVVSHDRGQAPQRGGWLTTTYGKGRWTYMAYALHRQVPFGVPGAYRILANLLSAGRR